MPWRCCAVCRRSAGWLSTGARICLTHFWRGAPCQKHLIPFHLGDVAAQYVWKTEVDYFTASTIGSDECLAAYCVEKIERQQFRMVSDLQASGERSLSTKNDKIDVDAAEKYHPLDVTSALGQEHTVALSTRNSLRTLTTNSVEPQTKDAKLKLPQVSNCRFLCGCRFVGIIRPLGLL